MYSTGSYHEYIMMSVVCKAWSESRAKIIITIISIGQVTTTIAVINCFRISSDVVAIEAYLRGVNLVYNILEVHVTLIFQKTLVLF